MKKTGANYVLITSIIWAAILTCVLIYFLRRHEVRTATEAPTPMLAVGPRVSTATVGKPSTVNADMPLSPVQLTPQQIQSIGVLTGLPQYKHLDDDLRASGTVAIND